MLFRSSGSHAAQTSVAALIVKALQYNKISLPDGFHEFDFDGDGLISTDDLKQVAADLRLTDNLNSTQILQWHSAANVSQSGALNKQEWLAALDGADASVFKFVDPGLQNDAGSAAPAPAAAAPELDAAPAKPSNLYPTPPDAAPAAAGAPAAPALGKSGPSFKSKQPPVLPLAQIKAEPRPTDAEVASLAPEVAAPQGGPVVAEIGRASCRERV